MQMSVLPKSFCHINVAFATEKYYDIEYHNTKQGRVKER